jgi:hypothetical protein
MPAPTIDALPIPPSRGDSPTTFSEDADAFLGALPDFRSQINAVAAYLATLESGTISLLLAAIDAAGSGANKLPYYTGSNTVALADLSAFGRSILDDADAAAVRATIGAATVSDTVYGSGWNGDTTVAPSKNAVYDKIEAVIASAGAGTVTSVATAGLATGGTIIGTGTITVTAAAASDINTGTDTTKALTADALAGSNLGTQTISLLVSDPNGSAITTGDGKAYWRVPSTLNGMDLVGVAAHVTTVSSSGIPTVQIANVTDSVDMLSTKLTIDASEKDSSTAAAAAVIDATHDDVATGDELRIDIDVAGTGAKGLIVEMQFRLP